MPLNDRDLQALRHLVTQVKRIADALNTPAEQVDAVLPPDNGARIVPRVILPGAEEHAHAFQAWLHDNTPKPWHPFKLCSVTIEGAFGRPLGPCVLRYQHDGPVHRNADDTSWVTSGAAEAAEDGQLRERLHLQLRALDRVRKALDDRPALTTDSLYERGWSDASEVVRNALGAPAEEEVAEESRALDRVIDAIAMYEDWHLGGRITAGTPLDVARHLRAAVDGQPKPPGWEPGKPTP